MANVALVKPGLTVSGSHAGGSLGEATQLGARIGTQKLPGLTQGNLRILQAKPTFEWRQPLRLLSGTHAVDLLYSLVSTAALAIFKFGQEEAAKRGLLLVDTKYEFGKDANGEIMLIDEIHTPDSSRYWIADTFEERLAAGKEPENIDKEFLRLWFRANCDPYADEVLSVAPKELVVELSKRYIYCVKPKDFVVELSKQYIYLYEKITGELFQVPSVDILSRSAGAATEGISVMKALLRAI
eukprot:gene8188-1448_t